MNPSLKFLETMYLLRYASKRRLRSQDHDHVFEAISVVQTSWLPFRVVLRTLYRYQWDMKRASAVGASWLRCMHVHQAPAISWCLSSATIVAVTFKNLQQCGNILVYLGVCDLSVKSQVDFGCSQRGSPLSMASTLLARLQYSSRRWKPAQALLYPSKEQKYATNTFLRMPTIYRFLVTSKV